MLGFTVAQLLHRNVQRFGGGLVFKAHRLLYHSTLGLRVIKNEKKFTVARRCIASSRPDFGVSGFGFRVSGFGFRV